MGSTPTSTCSGHRTLLVLIAGLLAVIAALVTGILAVAGGANLAAAAISGGGAFVLVVPVALLVESHLGLFSSSDQAESRDDQS